MVSILYAALTIIILTGSAPHSQSPVMGRNFDSFRDIGCESEEARLDNLAVTLQNAPTAKAAIIFYGGQVFRGRLPRRGDAAARAARIKPYLVNRRGIPADQVVVIDGGYLKEWYAEIWIVPPGASIPQSHPTVPIEQVHFRKGKAHPRDFLCGI